MDIYFWGMAVLVIVLLLSLYYNFSNTRHITAGSYHVRSTTDLHVKDVRPKENLKKKRKHVSIQSELSFLNRPVQMSNNDKLGSDEISGTEDESDYASTDPCDRNTLAEEMRGPDIDISEDEYNIYRSFVDKKELAECIWMNGKFKGLCKFVSEHREEWKNKQVKIAVAGNSGTGKSSLINTLRGMQPDDEGAAKTGVTETTTKPVAYPFPNNDKLLIVDLPGMGTINFPKESYMKDMEVSTYDAFLIVASGRITENDVWFVNEAMRSNKYVLFVRTKIDFDLFNAKRDNPKEFVKDSCLDEIRNEIINTFLKGRLPIAKLSGIYLVSSRDKDRYDFPKLEETLKKMLNVLGRAMRNILKEHIQSSRTMGSFLFEYFFFNKHHLKAFLCDMVPADILDLPSSLKDIHQFYLHSFYLDDHSLEQVSKELGKSVYDIKKKLKSFDGNEVKKATTDNFIYKSLWNIPYYLGTIRSKQTHMRAVMAADVMTLIDIKLDIIEKELSLL